MARKKTTKVKKSVYERLEEQQERRSGGQRFWKPPKGVSQIRLLPFTHDGEEDIFVCLRNHWIRDGENPNQRKPILCMDSLDAECPICTLMDSLDDEAQEALRPKRTYLVNLVVRRDPEADGLDAFRVAELSSSCVEVTDRANGLSRFLKPKSTDFVKDALDPKKGRDFRIKRTGEGMKTRYITEKMPKATAIGNVETDVIDLWDTVEKRAKDAAEMKEIVKLLSERYS